MELNLDLEQEISEHPWDPVQAETLQEINPVIARGRPKLQDLWTSVISLQHVNLNRLEFYQIKDDLIFGKRMTDSIACRIIDNWQPIFYPREFALQNPLMTLEQFSLTTEVLKEQAELVTRIRAEITQRALSCQNQQRRSIRIDLQRVNRLAERLKRWNTYTRLRENYVENTDWQQVTPPALRQRTKNRAKLSNDEILEISHKAIVLGEQYLSLAKEYRVSQARICQIVKKVQANRNVLEEMQTADVQKKDRHSTIRQVIEQMMIQTDHISSANEVCWELQYEFGMEVKRWEVYRILKKDLDMSYRRIKHAAIMGNSVRNLVLRQQWALHLFRLASEGKHFLNIDETWLSQAEHRRRKWGVKGTPNSVPVAPMHPRISVIACISSLGEVFLSLTQQNTNESIMEIYLHKLTQKLDREKPGWRDDYVIFLDGASYHQSQSTLKVMKALQLPILFCGPHGYSASPIELFFSLLKSTNLNTEDYPLGKANFKNVVEIVIRRVQEIEKRTLLLLFHHAFQRAFEYLVFKPL